MKFIRSLILFVVVVLAFSCKKKPASRDAVQFTGIPANAKITCGPRFHDYEMTCVADGRAYSCISSNPAGCNGDETISCGAYGAPTPAPEPQYVPPPDMPPPVTTENDEMPMLRPNGVPGISSGFGWW